MIEGLWTGEWRSNVSNISVGAGVVIFRQGKVFGGNDRFYSKGTYRLVGAEVEGEIESRYFAGDPLTIFGLADVDQAETLLFRGELQGDQIKLEGWVRSNPKLKLQGLLQRKAGPEIF